MEEEKGFIRRLLKPGTSPVAAAFFIGNTVLLNVLKVAFHWADLVSLLAVALIAIVEFVLWLVLPLLWKDVKPEILDYIRRWKRR